MATSSNDIALIDITLVSSTSKIFLEEYDGGGGLTITTSMDIPEDEDIKKPYHSFPFYVAITIEGFDADDPEKGNAVFETSCNVKGLFRHKYKKRVYAKDIHREKNAYGELLYVWARNYIDNQINKMNITGIYLPWHLPYDEHDDVAGKLESPKKRKTKKRKTKKKIRKKV